MVDEDPTSSSSRPSFSFFFFFFLSLCIIISSPSIIHRVPHYVPDDRQWRAGESERRMKRKIKVQYIGRIEKEKYLLWKSCFFLFLFLFLDLILCRLISERRDRGAPSAHLIPLTDREFPLIMTQEKNKKGGKVLVIKWEKTGRLENDHHFLGSRLIKIQPTGHHPFLCLSSIHLFHLSLVALSYLWLYGGEYNASLSSFLIPSSHFRFPSGSNQCRRLEREKKKLKKDPYHHNNKR